MAHPTVAEQTLRCAHVSDLHYCEQYLPEADRCFRAAVDHAIAARAQVAVLSGDATQHGLKLHSPAAHALGEQVHRLADCCPVLMLQGTYSHEPRGSLTLFRMLGARHPVHVADRLQQVALMADGSWQASPGWRFDQLPAGPIRALFSCVPTVNPATLAGTIGAEQAATALAEHLATLLAGMGEVNRAARRRGIPTLGVGHGTVSGCVSEHGVPMAGLDHEFSLGALFDACADAFLLGHIHKHQQWQRAGQVVAYAGSTGRFHYGEQGEKGMLLWDVEAGRAQARLLPLPARRTVDLAFDGPPDPAALADAVREHGLAGASVRVRWNVGEAGALAVDRAALLKALEGAAEVKLEGRVVPVQTSRVPGISLQPGLAAKAAMWARISGVDDAALALCMAELGEHGAAAIAARILDGAPAAAPLAARARGETLVATGEPS